MSFTHQFDFTKYPFNILSKRSDLVRELTTSLRNELYCVLFVRPTSFEIRFPRITISSHEESLRKLKQFLDTFLNKYILKLHFELAKNVILNVDELQLLRASVETYLSNKKVLIIDLKEPPNGYLNVEGFKDEFAQSDYQNLKKLIEEFYQKIRKNELDLPFESYLLDLLRLERFEEILQKKFPQSSIKIQINSIKLEGSQLEIEQSRSQIDNLIRNLKYVELEFDLNLVDYFRDNLLYVNEVLHQNTFKVTLRVKQENMIELATLDSEKALIESTSYLKKNYACLIRTLDRNCVELIRNKMFLHFLANFRAKILASSTTTELNQFKVNVSSSSVSVAGEKCFVKSVYDEIETFFMRNAIYTKILYHLNQSDLEYLELFAWSDLEKLNRELRSQLKSQDLNNNNHFMMIDDDMQHDKYFEEEDKEKEYDTIGVSFDLNKRELCITSNEIFFVRFEECIAKYLSHKQESEFKLENNNFHLIDKEKLKKELEIYKNESTKCLIKLLQNNQKEQTKLESNSLALNSSSIFPSSSKSDSFLDKIRFTNIYQEGFFADDQTELIDVIVIYSKEVFFVKLVMLKSMDYCLCFELDGTKLSLDGLN
jgi:hypothetical protein